MATFYFRDKEARAKAYNILAGHNFYFPYGPNNNSLKDIDNPDYMLELLATEGFNTAEIIVEKSAVANPKRKEGLEECHLAFKASKELLEEKCKGKEITEDCKLALKAASGLIGEKCSVPHGKTVELYGATVTVPSEVMSIGSSNPELTREQRIKAITETAWARGWAEGMCKLVSPELVGREREACIERMSRTLAERVV